MAAPLAPYLRTICGGGFAAVLMTLHGFESVGLSAGTCRWTFHRSWISYALVQATVGAGTVLIWDLILIPNVVQPNKTWVW